MSTTMTRDETTIDLDELTRDGLFYEYSRAADPIGSGASRRCPSPSSPPRCTSKGRPRVIPLDLSRELGCPGPATSPSLCANFVHIRPGRVDRGSGPTPPRRSTSSCGAAGGPDSMA